MELVAKQELKGRRDNSIDLVQRAYIVMPFECFMSKDNALI